MPFVSTDRYDPKDACKYSLCVLKSNRKFFIATQREVTMGRSGGVGRGVGSGRKSDGVKNDQNFKCSLEPREHSPKIF